MFGTKQKNKCGCKRMTTPRTDKCFARNSKLHARKTNTDLQRELLATRGVDDLTTDRQYDEGSLKQRDRQDHQSKSVINTCNEAKTFALGQKISILNLQYWNKIVFSEETHFLFKGFEQHLSDETLETTSENNILIKQLSTLNSRCFGVILHLADLGALYQLRE
ncbi:hypothetical protein CDAR_384231 [Caerostris darwini]|uniref:Uncharacterized protein n=1 Tax=Caerostris darwini TaxID=1538125 RepID=A0AAV4QYQ5_9ARAC|nr:hypothetical protein CDAR_384231 [Caerostris darwini]